MQSTPLKNFLGLVISEAEGVVQMFCKNPYPGGKICNSLKFWRGKWVLDFPM